MTSYEALLDEAHKNGLVVKEKPLKYNNGRIKGKRIAIRKDIETTTEKACVLAEELGHHYTAVGNILDQSSDYSRKQELKGRVMAYNKMVGLRGIVDAYNNHCQNANEAAEYLGVTTEFLNEAISCYRSKYGTYATLDNYVIFFEPNLGVLEIKE